MNKNLFAPRTFIWKTLRQPDGHAIGAVLALEDLASDLASPRSPRRMMAADYLLPDFHVLTPDMTLGQALQLFLNFRGERLPVIDPESKSAPILGVVHKTSLLDAYVRMNPATH